MQSWCKTWQLSGSNLTHAKQNFHMRRNKSLLKFLEPLQAPKVVYTQTTRRKLGEHVKFYHGITALQHLIDPRQMVSLMRAVQRVKEGTSARLQKSGLVERWWVDSMECNCCLRKWQRPPGRREKTPYERRFGEPFIGPIIPFGAMVEYHPTSPKDQVRYHQFLQERITRNLSWL